MLSSSCNTCTSSKTPSRSSSLLKVDCKVYTSFQDESIPAPISPNPADYKCDKNQELPVPQEDSSNKSNKTSNTMLDLLHTIVNSSSLFGNGSNNPFAYLQALVYNVILLNHNTSAPPPPPDSNNSYRTNYGTMYNQQELTPDLENQIHHATSNASSSSLSFLRQKFLRFIISISCLCIILTLIGFYWLKF